MSSGNSNQDQQPPTLRDYQLEAVQTFKNAINNGYTRIALSAPTGSGKTVIFAAIIRDILQQHPGGKVLVIVDSKELAVQAERKIRAAFPGDLSVGHIRKDLPDAANRV
jgi:ATP-dependent helicase IRC3